MLAAVAAHIPSPADVAVAPARAADAAAVVGWFVRTEPLGAQPDAALDGILLLDDELSRAGEHAEGMVAEAARALKPGGVLALTVRNRIHAAATGAVLDGRGFSADELVRAVGQRGFTVELIAAPGATELLAGRSSGELHPHLDRQPGLLDAAPRTLVVARAPADPGARSAAFFASIPLKVAAAAVLCRDDAGRLLVVHDSFRRHWTIPGGVVDADESPLDAARREAWEEAGVAVTVGDLLGVFAASWPDRLTFVYGATPTTGHTPVPAPVHAHEIDGAAWLPLDEALDLLAAYVADQVRCCLDAPGRTWQR